MWRMILAASVGAGFVVLGACGRPAAEMEAYRPPEGKDYGRPLPPGALALRKIDPSAYPDFGRGFAHRAGLEQAIRNSLEYLAKPSSEKYYPYGEITHRRVVASLKRFLEILATVQSPEQLDAAIRTEYDVYQSVGCDDCGTVYFTGYYCPIFEGRKQRDSQFRYPLYGLPPDLVKDEEGMTLGRTAPDGSVEPTYPTRRQIEEGRLLDGHEVAWLKDPFEAYVVTVQGSAKLRLADGSLYELGYAGNNGHEYTPVATAMLSDGVLDRGRVSLQGLLNYFAQHRDQIYHYCWENDRYVFFAPRDGGPYGSLNVSVTPYRTIATDKQVFPRAALSFVTTYLPELYDGGVAERPYGAFSLDQDTGGAIRAAGRCDVYMGIGRTGQAVAGRTGSEGCLYYVFLKEPAAGGGTDFP